MSGETRGMKTSSVSLFDLLLQQRKKPAASEKSNVRVVKSHHVVEAPLKSFVANGRRRKGLSSFKKKILMERLEHHRKPIPASPSDSGSRTLRLLRFIDEEALSDPDELEELLLNARELLSPFDGLETVSYQGCDVIALFGSVNAAALASSTLRELVVGGETLRVETAAAGSGSCDTASEAPADVCTLRLSGLVTSEDVEDEESTAEVLSDIGVLLGGLGFSRLWIEPGSTSRSICSESVVLTTENRMCSCQRVSPAMVLVSVLVSEGASLMTMGEAMHRSCVPQGLYSVTAYENRCYSDEFFADVRDVSLEYQVCLLGFAQADQLEDEDERLELTDNVLSLCAGVEGNPLRVSFSEGDSTGSYDAVVLTPSCAQALCLAGTLMGQRVGGEALVVELSVAMAGGSPLKLFSSRNCRIVLGMLDNLNTDGLSSTIKLSCVEQLQGQLPGGWIERVVAVHSPRPSCASLVSLSDSQGSLDVCVGFPTIASAQNALAEMDGRVVGGAVVEATLKLCSNAVSEATQTPTFPKDSPVTLVPSSAKEEKPRVAKYAEARAVPKLPRHDQPSDFAFEFSAVKVSLVVLCWFP